MAIKYALENAVLLLTWLCYTNAFYCAPLLVEINNFLYIA